MDIKLYEIDDIYSSLPLDSLNYLHSPVSVTASESLLVIADMNNFRIVLCDTSFQKAVAVGNRGLGPGEFISPSYAFLKNHKLYVVDYRSSRVQIFDKALEYIDGIKAPGIQNYSTIAVDKKDNIYIPGSSADGAIEKINFKTKVSRSLKLTENKNLVFMNNNSKGNFSKYNIGVDDKGYFYKIGVFEPVVVKYDTSFNIIWKSNYANYPPIRTVYDELVQKTQKMQEEEGVIVKVSICNDFDISNNRIYILPPNKIGIIGLDTESGKVIEHIRFKSDENLNTEPLLAKFCFNNNKIYFIDVISGKIGVASLRES